MLRLTDSVRSFPAVRRPPDRAVATAAISPLPVTFESADVEGVFDDIVQEWGEQSFPASDPPANW